MDWSSHLVVGQPSSREDGDLLSSGDTVHAIDGGDAGLDHLLGVDTTLRVDGLTWKYRECQTQDRKMVHFPVHHADTHTSTTLTLLLDTKICLTKVVTQLNNYERK